MDGPSDDIRGTIGQSFETIENEGQVEAVLSDIQGLIEADIQQTFDGDGDPEEMLAPIYRRHGPRSLGGIRTYERQRRTRTKLLPATAREHSEGWADRE